MDNSKMHHEKLLQKFRDAVHKEYKTKTPGNIEELIDRILTEQTDLKALTVNVRDKGGHILKRAEIGRRYLRQIIVKEIRNQ